LGVELLRFGEGRKGRSGIAHDGESRQYDYHQHLQQKGSSLGWRRHGMHAVMARPGERAEGAYIAETLAVSVESDYVVVDL